MSVQRRGFHAATAIRTLRSARFLTSLFVLLGVIGVGSASALADPTPLPVFNGSLAFPSIESPSGPEEFSWEVPLSAGGVSEQELQAIDDQTAGVYYTKVHQLSYTIYAESAHDATGATVPTSLKVSEGKVLTLIVHHRDGNPAAGGAPFVYPILAGEGYETQYSPAVVLGSLTEPEKAAPSKTPETPVSNDCLVPKLQSKTLKASKKRLENADCKLGEVRKLKGATAKTGKVSRQNPPPGAVRAPGTAVKITLSG